MMTFPNIRRLLAVGLLTISALIGFASSPPASDNSPAVIAALSIEEAQAHRVTDKYCFAAHRAPALEKARHPKSRHGTTATFLEHRTIWGWMARICRDNGWAHNQIHWKRCELLPAKTTIACVWGYGARGRQAQSVVWCESARTYGWEGSWRAENGQYLGAFQMGSDERRRWGHGSSVLSQSRAAKGYYDYALSIGWGNGWGPWSCKPW